MVDIDVLKVEVKKLNVKVMQVKMDLYDFLEELLINWEQIFEVVQKVYDVYVVLMVVCK